MRGGGEDATHGWKGADVIHKGWGGRRDLWAGGLVQPAGRGAGITRGWGPPSESTPFHTPHTLGPTCLALGNGKCQ